MSVLPMNCEIVELPEKYESECFNGGGTACGRQVFRKHSFEDDINKLFEALETSHRRRSGGSSRRSAMKRPVRGVAAASPHVLDNNGPPSDNSVTLKQALRGLCISQASEMAAAKKRSARPSASESVASLSQPAAGRDSLKRGSGSPALSDLLMQNGEARPEMPPKKIPATGKNSSAIKKKTLEDAGAEDGKRSKHKWGSSDSSKNSNTGECSSSSTTSNSEESSDGYRSRGSRDSRWKAIGSVERKQGGKLDLRHLKVLNKIGSGGDIGTVYLCQLIGTRCFFAMKVIDTELLRRRKKLQRVEAETEILKILHHPFLLTLYAHFTTNKFCCLVTDYCPGGDLRSLRLKQRMNRFSEKAARFYVAEVLLALEYLHVLGIVYRGLRPENVLISEDGHIVLSDFNLSVKCSSSNPPSLEASASSSSPSQEHSKRISGGYQFVSSCMNPCQLTCFSPRFPSFPPNEAGPADLADRGRIVAVPQPVVEPAMARSNSLVGGKARHEYLAPEIVGGGGHGSSVDWWTLGILMYELLYGVTPFRGTSDEDTVKNVVSESVRFPETVPGVSSRARDLIRRLLNKEPEGRLGSIRGAAEIKMHPFFQGVNWALIRSETPPQVPTHKTTTKFELQDDGKELVMF